MRRVSREQLEECHEPTVPRLIAPALADRPPQPVLLVGLVEHGARLLAGQLREQHTCLDLEMRIRPEVRRRGHAVLPDLPGGAIAQHRGPPLALLAPRDLLAQRYLRLADMEARLRGVGVFVQSLGATQVFPRPAE